MSETAINAMFTLFIATLLVAVTVVVVVGTVQVVYSMVTEMMDDIRERKKGSEE